MKTNHPLMELIDNRTAVVGVVGLGYVGLPLVQAFMAAGYRTMGFDVDDTKVASLLAGKSYIEHIAVGVDRRLRSQPASSCPPRTWRGWPSRRDSDLRADAAERQPRPGPELRRGDRRADRQACCAPANSSCWRARPTRAPRATWCCRSWPTRA